MTAPSSGSASSSLSPMTAQGFTGGLTPGNGAATQEWRSDFPENHPLCKVRCIKGQYVTFCLSFAEKPGLCDAHLFMRTHGKGGDWTGEYELTIRAGRGRAR